MVYIMLNVKGHPQNAPFEGINCRHTSLSYFTNHFSYNQVVPFETHSMNIVTQGFKGVILLIFTPYLLIFFRFIKINKLKVYINNEVNYICGIIRNSKFRNSLE